VSRSGATSVLKLGGRRSLLFLTWYVIVSFLPSLSCVLTPNILLLYYLFSRQAGATPGDANSLRAIQMMMVQQPQKMKSAQSLKTMMFSDPRIDVPAQSHMPMTQSQRPRKRCYGTVLNHDYVQ
ncbi:unnamed protein product, partial [Laminaria digitata]